MTLLAGIKVAFSELIIAITLSYVPSLLFGGLGCLVFSLSKLLGFDEENIFWSIIYIALWTIAGISYFSIFFVASSVLTGSKVKALFVAFSQPLLISFIIILVVFYIRIAG